MSKLARPQHDVRMERANFFEVDLRDVDVVDYDRPVGEYTATGADR